MMILNLLYLKNINKNINKIKKLMNLHKIYILFYIPILNYFYFFKKNDDNKNFKKKIRKYSNNRKL